MSLACSANTKVIVRNLSRRHIYKKEVIEEWKKGGLGLCRAAEVTLSCFANTRPSDENAVTVPLGLVPGGEVVCSVEALTHASSCLTSCSLTSRSGNTLLRITNKKLFMVVFETSRENGL